MSVNGNSATVLLIADDFPPAICGIGDYAAQLANVLSKKGVKVTVLTKLQPGSDQAGPPTNYLVRRLIRGWSHAEIGTVLRELDGLPLRTIVHIQYSSASGYNRRLMINILPAVLRVLRPQARVVVTMHGFHETRYRWRLRATPMLVAPHRCILVHPRDYALLTRTLPIRNRSELVPIWSNIPSILSSAQDQIVTRESLGLAASDRVVVFFGDMREEKGVLELLEAVSRARSRVRRLKVMLVGALQSNPVSAPDSYKCELLKAMQQAQRENELVMVRNPEPIRVAQLLRAADLAVFPFRNGAAGNRGSVLAAIVNEVAVLTTSGTSTPDGFAEEYGVDTVPAGTLAALTNRMVELLLDPRQVTDLRRRSSRAAGRFSWDAIAERHLEIYRGLLPPASQRAGNNLQ